MARILTTAMHLENELWRFALFFYSRPGVEAACLALQDQFGLSVNRLILACWAGQQGIVLRATDFADSPALAWQQQVTLPVRAARYQVRHKHQEHATLDACYQALREAELCCEQVELALLYAAVAERRQVSPPEDLVQQNLACYLQTQSQSVAGVSALLAPLYAALADPDSD
ncbi:TIGR02444 family protein [Pontibacter sp. JAM-7]|uniref:TIGR02444 family protein n=1 Tax=Pontibacter sp. JAM-7 TaxID=3366581 RepID=UPI003AF85A57